jgi:hypothetical protein
MFVFEQIDLSTWYLQLVSSIGISFGLVVPIQLTTITARASCKQTVLYLLLSLSLSHSAHALALQLQLQILQKPKLTKKQKKKQQ